VAFVNPVDGLDGVGEVLVGRLVDHLPVDGDRARPAGLGLVELLDGLDGNETTGLDLPKSNWALPIDEPPFTGYPVTGGMTFAFGGVAINTDAEVLDTRDEPIPGLYGAGNATGGLFYDNYPGGTGLTNAAVFGKVAAESAIGELDLARPPSSADGPPSVADAVPPTGRRVSDSLLTPSRRQGKVPGPRQPTECRTTRCRGSVWGPSLIPRRVGGGRPDRA